eukprot:TRINITY_DN13205_c0_g1_i2.p1 TRINITY_DN13205_c0_g1~~TRINITY_DN13205_c0_g1_i2.p1  ORF type:complete len:1811 (+),score=163.80 TRINITY_DN13205_c0_g1_i2:74-5506(+)
MQAVLYAAWLAICCALLSSSAVAPAVASAMDEGCHGYTGSTCDECRDGRVSPCPSACNTNYCRHTCDSDCIIASSRSRRAEPQACVCVATHCHQSCDDSCDDSCSCTGFACTCTAACDAGCDENCDLCTWMAGRACKGPPPCVCETDQPTLWPTYGPSASPSRYPTTAPSHSPSAAPSHSPSAAPSHSPSVAPSIRPSAHPSITEPTTAPSSNPSTAPSRSPSVVPSNHPSAAPSSAPTMPPSGRPSAAPSSSPSVGPSPSSPTAAPSRGPSAAPSGSPSVAPSSSPSVTPSRSPVVSPSHSPSVPPSRSPSAAPSWSSPSHGPSAAPSSGPSNSPSGAPSTAPSKRSPSSAPSSKPSTAPSTSPSIPPSSSPSATQGGSSPSTAPSSPSVAPSRSPSAAPGSSPATSPSSNPSVAPSSIPLIPPMSNPSWDHPSTAPTWLPTRVPTEARTSAPAGSTQKPTKQPTVSRPPTLVPTHSPTSFPTPVPTASPLQSQTGAPIANTLAPTEVASVRFTSQDGTNWDCRTANSASNKHVLADADRCRQSEVYINPCSLQNPCRNGTCTASTCRDDGSGYAQCSYRTLEDGTSCSLGANHAGKCQAGRCSTLPSDCGSDCDKIRKDRGWHPQCIAEEGCHWQNQGRCIVHAANPNRPCTNGTFQGFCTNGVCARPEPCDRVNCAVLNSQCATGKCVVESATAGNVTLRKGRCVANATHEGAACGIQIPEAGKALITSRCQSARCMWPVKLCMGKLVFHWTNSPAQERKGLGDDALFMITASAESANRLSGTNQDPPGTVNLTLLQTKSDGTELEPRGYTINFTEPQRFPKNYSLWTATRSDSGCNPITWKVEYTWTCSMEGNVVTAHSPWLLAHEQDDPSKTKQGANLEQMFPFDNGNLSGHQVQCIRITPTRARGACRTSRCGELELSILPGTAQVVQVSLFFSVIVLFVVLFAVETVRFRRFYLSLKAVGYAPLTAKRKHVQAGTCARLCPSDAAGQGAGAAGEQLQPEEVLFEECMKLFRPLVKMWNESPYQDLLKEMEARLVVPDGVDKLDRLAAMLEQPWAQRPQAKDQPTQALSLRFFTQEPADIDREMLFGEVPLAKSSSFGHGWPMYSYGATQAQSKDAKPGKAELEEQAYKRYKEKFGGQRNANHYFDPCRLSREWVQSRLFDTAQGLSEKWIKHVGVLLLQSSNVVRHDTGTGLTHVYVRMINKLSRNDRKKYERCEPGDWMALPQASSFSKRPKGLARFLGDYPTNSVMLRVFTEDSVGANLRELTMYPEEREVLLPMFGMMEVRKVQKIRACWLWRYVEGLTCSQFLRTLFHRGGLLVIDLEWMSTLEQYDESVASQESRHPEVGPFLAKVRKDAESADRNLHQRCAAREPVLGGAPPAAATPPRSPPLSGSMGPSPADSPELTHSPLSTGPPRPVLCPQDYPSAEVSPQGAVSSALPRLGGGSPRSPPSEARPESTFKPDPAAETDRGAQEAAQVACTRRVSHGSIIVRPGVSSDCLIAAIDYSNVYASDSESAGGHVPQGEPAGDSVDGGSHEPLRGSRQSRSVTRSPSPSPTPNWAGSPVTDADSAPSGARSARKGAAGPAAAQEHQAHLQPMPPPGFPTRTPPFPPPPPPAGSPPRQQQQQPHEVSPVLLQAAQDAAYHSPLVRSPGSAGAVAQWTHPPPGETRVCPHCNARSAVGEAGGAPWRCPSCGDAGLQRQQSWTVEQAWPSEPQRHSPSAPPRERVSPRGRAEQQQQPQHGKKRSQSRSRSRRARGHGGGRRGTRRRAPDVDPMDAAGTDQGHSHTGAGAHAAAAPSGADELR